MLVWDTYTWEADRMTDSELTSAQSEDPSRYILIGEDTED